MQPPPEGVDGGIIRSVAALAKQYLLRRLQPLQLLHIDIDMHILLFSTIVPEGFLNVASFSLPLFFGLRYDVTTYILAPQGTRCTLSRRSANFGVH